MALELVTLAQCKAYLGLSDSDWDTDLQALITTVCSRIEKFLGRVLLKTTYTEVLDVAERQQVFRLKAFPVDTGQSFTVKNDPDQDWANTTAEDADNYVLQATYGRLHFKRDYTLIDGPQALQVAYTGGLSADQAGVPDEIETAAKMFVSEVWNRRKELGAKNVSIGGFAVSTEKPVTMPRIVAEILWDHRAPWAKLGSPRRP